MQRLATPHAATNAVILPHSFGADGAAEPTAIGGLDPTRSELCDRGRGACAGVTRLREFGHTLDDYRSLVPAMLERPDLARTPGATGADLVGALEAAW